jgi:hypothetical protein
MNLYMSTGALVVLGLAVLAGVAVHRWTQQRTDAGVPQRRGDLGQAVMAAAAVAAALSTMLLVSGPSAPDPDRTRPSDQGPTSSNTP